MSNLPGLPDISPGTIYCIGRNYQKHAEELGNAVPDEPMVFLKPASSIIHDGQAIILPSRSTDVHHEVELVIAIGKAASHISTAKAHQYIAGYGVGIDVTARDVQQQAKNRGHPWSVAKGFRTFAPLSAFRPMSDSTNFGVMELSLTVNNEQRQHGLTKHMIFTVEELVAHLSTIFNLQPGDLIFTGTPEGVSPIRACDRINASLNNDECTLSLSVQHEQ